MSKAIKIVIAEDHELVRAGLIAVLNNHDQIEVIGEAIDGLEALERVRTLEPDILMLDLSMPKMGGLSVFQQMKRRYKDTHVIILTAAENILIWHELIELGVSGLLNKSVQPNVMIDCVETVAKGNNFIQPEIQHTLNQVPDLTNKRLSVREKQVVKLVAEGMKTKEIAECLDISDRTVSKHRENVMTKMGANSTAEIISYANEIGLNKVDVDEIE